MSRLVLTNDVSLTLTLYNVRSLKKHVIDILEDTGLLRNDALIFNRNSTWAKVKFVTYSDQNSCRFSYQFNLNEKKCRSILVCSSNNVSVIDHQRYNGILVLTLIKPQFPQTPVTVAVICRFLSSSMSIFLSRVARELSCIYWWKILMLIMPLIMMKIRDCGIFMTW